jgi:hypothetical protein
MKLLSALPLLALALAACDRTPGRIEPGTLPDGGRTSVPEHATTVPPPSAALPGDQDAGTVRGPLGDTMPGTKPFHPKPDVKGGAPQ